MTRLIKRRTVANEACDAGKIEVNAQTKLEVKVGANIVVTLNGSTGGITVQATNISLESIGKMNLKGTGSATLTGATVSVKADANMNVSSQGILGLSGNVVKIG